MNKFWTNPDYKISKMRDSLEVNSGTPLAYMVKDNFFALVQTNGDIRINYKDDVYRYADEIPEAVLEALIEPDKHPEMYANGELEMVNNNWFECFVFEITDPTFNADGYVGEKTDFVSRADNHGKVLLINGDVVEDFAGRTDEELQALLSDWIAAMTSPSQGR
jgi:hypothetical protein